MQNSRKKEELLKSFMKLKTLPTKDIQKNEQKLKPFSKFTHGAIFTVTTKTVE